jgi:hypothetical protein
MQILSISIRYRLLDDTMSTRCQLYIIIYRYRSIIIKQARHLSPQLSEPLSKAFIVMGQALLKWWDEIPFDADDVFSYVTSKEVRILDRWVGGTKHSVIDGVHAARQARSTSVRFRVCLMQSCGSHLLERAYGDLPLHRHRGGWVGRWASELARGVDS